MLQPSPELTIVVIMNDVTKFSVCIMDPIQRDVCIILDLAFPHGLNYEWSGGLNKALSL